MRLNTWDKTENHIASGRGTGHFDLFLSWLLIHRKNASPKSNQVVSRMPGYRRNSNFFARIEWYIALLCLWLGALDIREQFPLWPMPHPHPLQDGVVRWDSKRVRGLIEIAAEAGIRHGIAPGSSDVPYIATIDIMATIPGHPVERLAGLSLKPHDQVSRAEPTDRLLERQELERRYMREIDGHFAIPDASLISKTLQGNLDVLSGYFAKAHPNDPRSFELWRVVEQASASLPFDAALRLGAAAAGLHIEEARKRFHSAVWHRMVDVDITKPMRADLPLTYGARDLVAALQTELFGAPL